MSLTQLQARLRAYFPEALIYDGSHISPAMGAKGAYLLILELGDPAHFQRARVAGSLPPGSYVYAGSARGAGGIAARLGRHFRRDKTVHWHIDELTVMADLAALALPGGSECGIVRGCSIRVCSGQPFRGSEAATASNAKRIC